MIWLTRFIKYVVGFFFVAAIALIGAVIYLAATESGLHQLYAVGRRLVPGELKIDDLQGRIWGPLTISGLDYRTDKWTLHIDRIHYEWEPQELWQGLLHVRELNVESVRFHRLVIEPPKPIDLPDILFPIQVRVDHASLDGLTVSSVEQTAPFTLAHAELQARTHGQDVEVGMLSLRDPRFEVDARGQFTPQNFYSLNVQANWQVIVPRAPRMSGQGRIWGDLATLHVDQQIAQPSPLQLQATLRNVLDTEQLRWEAHASARRPVMLRTWNENWPDVSISGRIQAHGDVESVEARGRVRTRYQPYTVDSKFSVAYGKDDVLHLRQAELSLADNPARVLVRGRIAGLRQNPRANLQGSWENLGWPLDEAPRFSSAAGKFRLEGTPDDYRAGLSGDVQLPQLALSAVNISGHGDKTSFVAQRLEADLLGGHAQGDARVQWGPVLRWEAALQGTGLNPGVAYPEWPGSIALEVSTQGRRTGSGLTYSVELARIDGTLRDLPLSGRGALTSRGQDYTVDGVELHYGGNHVLADGRIGENWDLAWDVDAVELSQLYPPLSGELRAAGHVSGTREEPSLVISATAQRLAFQDFSVEQAGLAGTVDLARDQVHSALELRAVGLAAAGQRVEELGIVASGTPADHRIRVDAAVPRVSAAVELAGSYAERSWSGELESATVVDQRTGEWTLNEPVPVEASPLAAYTGLQCWTNQALGEFCGEGAWQGDAGWHATARGDDLSLSLLQEVLPAGVNLEGRVDFSAFASADPNGVIIGSASVAASPGSITQVLEGGAEEIGFGHRGARIDASLRAGELTASLGLSLVDQNTDTVTGGVGLFLTLPRTAMPGPLARSAVEPQAQEPFQARLTAEVRDISIVSAFAPSLENVRGQVSADLRAEGDPRAPTFAGDIRLADGHARVLPLGIELRDANVTASASGPGQLDISGQLRSGEGTLVLSGDARYEVNAPQRWSARVRASGENIQVANLPELVAVASPDLRATITPGQVDVRGEVVVPYARIQPVELGTAVRASPDVVIVDAPAREERKTAWAVTSEVRVVLGDNVRFRGFGVSTKLEGEVLLIDRPGDPTIARGEIRLEEGEYRAYGQNLQIERGRLMFFSGPVDNPGLEIRAVRHVDEVIAGILVRGSLKNPQVTLFSEPAMAETDILSYLVLGRPASQATGAEGEQLYGAAAALGLAGGGALASELGRRFGLEDVRIESGGQFGEAALVIRHYLSPKLYISYGVGLFEELNVVLIRYQINNRWALEAQSAGGESSGVDILYTIETE